jgi:hypothetical protein
MVTVVVINKSCNIQEKHLHEFNELQLNKLCKDKTDTPIQCLHVFGVTKDKCVGIFGKHNGIAGNENKYELPPPIDNILLFGNIVIVEINNSIKNVNNENIFENSVVSLSKEKWTSYYEQLFGGFESLSNSENDTDSVSDIYDSLEKTKSGYALDGFVVHDDEIIYVNANDSENDSDYETSEDDSDNEISENDIDNEISENDIDNESENSDIVH